MEIKVVFPENNRIPYGQDFSFKKGISSNIEFELVDFNAKHHHSNIADTMITLIADGYGKQNNYGNGPIHVLIEDLPEKIKKVIIESRLKEYVITDNYEDGLEFVELSLYIKKYKIEKRQISLPIKYLDPEKINEYENAKRIYNEIENEVRKLISKGK